MRSLFAFLFVLAFAVSGFAADVEIQGESIASYTDKSGKDYAVSAVPLTSDFSLAKPVIDSAKTLTKNEQDVVETALKGSGRLLIHPGLKPTKNDYANDFDRGTVEYNPKVRNYSFHKVIIPDGTTIRESNFTQKEPHTAAITGKNLTFIDCNMVNVEKDASWILQGCNNAQIKRTLKSESTEADGSKKLIISHQVEQAGKFTEIATDEQVVQAGDDYNLAKARLNK